MKKIALIGALMVLVLSCDKKSKIENEIEEIPIEIKVDRFDKAFFETAPQDLPKLKSQYPFFFPSGNDDSVWLEKIQNPQWRELYSEVQKKYPNFDTETEQIEELFQHIKFYFPQTKTPKVFTVIADMDYQNKVLYAKNTVIICLELYLGKDHKFYEFPVYIKQNFTQSQILPDIVSVFADKKIAYPTDPTLLSQMIYAGKKLYLADLLIPKTSDDTKIGYTPEQIKWCEENENEIWTYFIKKQLLYDTDQKLIPRFINPAPFSKFYLDLDNESPGRVGVWIGWQIVRSFMENNDVSVEQLTQMNAKELFEKSKYKPKK
ncbi:MAG TPA: gliding motility lipoprotein GldB [Flavobacterium sp.]|nr:gliding motility lipoprotein GldB [Flavobacterium sp.]